MGNSLCLSLTRLARFDSRIGKSKGDVKPLKDPKPKREGVLTELLAAAGYK